MKDFRNAVIYGLAYGMVVFILCRLNLSGRLFFPNRSWITDGLGSAIAAMVFVPMWYVFLRLNLLQKHEKQGFKNWKEASVNILIPVMLAESLLIAKALITGQKPDSVSLIMNGLGIAVGVSIAMAIIQAKNSSGDQEN